jgi:hypothetical protein
VDLTLEERLKKRKFDALRRGVHRVEEDSLPFNVHLVGVGKAGAAIVAGALKALLPSDRTMSALVVDVGGEDLQDVREAAAGLPPGRAVVDIVALDPVGVDALKSTFEDYQTYLKLEYPLYPWILDGKGWFPDAEVRLTTDGGVRRSYAKALYGRCYYDGDRRVADAIRRFGERVDRESAQSVVGVVFGVGGGAGSGIVVDLARHLTNAVLGRRVLVVGLGILPCDADLPQHRGGGLLATLNELDCFGDEAKNRGIVVSCGELFRNPFTAGLLLVPQQHVWRATRCLEKTHQRVNAEVVSLLTARGGTNLLETLRMLNWVAAPSTQHSAARTPWGDRWVHMFGFCDLDGGAVSPDADFRSSLGILDSYRPEFMEVRVPSSAHSVAFTLESIFAPEVSPQVTGGGRESSAQFVLPSIRKADLSWFKTALDVYGEESWDEKLLDHSLLLEQGIVLSEPSSRMEGMAGASLRDGESWIAVPMDDLWGHVAHHRT